MTAQVLAAARSPQRQHSPEVAAMLKRFPPRRREQRWAATEQTREQVAERLLAPPFTLASSAAQSRRRTGLTKTLAWLEQSPGQTWQDRWRASGADEVGNIAWRHTATAWLQSSGWSYQDPKKDFDALGSGMLALISGDVLRPSLTWLLTPGTVQILTAEMARSRDPEGFGALAAVCRTDPANAHTKDGALRRIATLMAAKGGNVRDITVGDCLEMADLLLSLGADSGRAVDTSVYFYQLLHAAGVFPEGALATVRIFNPKNQGQISVEQMIDRYGITCRAVRDLLVDYLRERALCVDYTSLRAVAFSLGKLFWKDLEDHHPGIASLRLSPAVAAGWKQRIALKTIRSATADGDTVEMQAPRADRGLQHLAVVRAFYLDLAQWAMDDPARWGVWAAPCPIREEEMSRRKEKASRKSRMDQRTRERLPVLPVLAQTVDAQRRLTAERLASARAVCPGNDFAVAGKRWHRPATKNPAARVWAVDPDTGQRIDLTLEEHRAFWSWAIVEVLRHTGIRIEELTELSHHSLVQYRLPGTGELIPLLHIAPSKTDAERLLVISPELADVLSTLISRIRDENGAVPLVLSYDSHERVWNPPMPLLFQRHVGLENRPIPPSGIRQLLNDALARTGLADTAGRPLTFSPHDFRRLFITDAIMNGMPPHIAQIVVGHRDINTTMGYKAVYPEEVINGHRAFIARRRATRPSEEYRTPTDEEWEEFLGHFERRRVALGDCGRAYGTSCVHEHSCLRCSLLRPDPGQRHRIVAIRDNLHDRIAEAEKEGWLGEVEGLKVSLAGAEDKLAQVDRRSHQGAVVDLGIPTTRSEDR
ncbi:tyrosine-type recombinase/integrase [Streptomyces sp. NBC_01320]|uniref:tyrosine-type recombinase/integrase n=1 Tax=Streptomyces sp. NBC_01320 TaxID=2903824 RepID=UPI002E0D5756|nr:site-specific integrase [Streptomyces sp. NBC_01320]WSK01190.1 site-specific integrase [Streptomyces sp. NBC_01320]